MAEWLFTIARLKDGPDVPEPIKRRERGLTFKKLEAIINMPFPFTEHDKPLTHAQLKWIVER